MNGGEVEGARGGAVGHHTLGGEATLDQVLKKTKASRLAATDAIVRLLAISALRSTYSAGAFRLSFPA